MILFIASEGRKYFPFPWGEALQKTIEKHWLRGLSPTGKVQIGFDYQDGR